MPLVNRSLCAIRFIAAQTVIAPLLLAGLSHVAAAATTVACIGEQTTKPGEGVAAAQMWPAVLGTLLGATYTVGNDVMNNGNTVTAGDCVTAASKAGPPGIVVIGPFAEHDYAAGLTETVWQADYQKVVNQYLALMPPPTVYVMTPPPAAFVYQSPAEQAFATDVVKPAVLAVAAATANVHVIDLFSDAKLAAGAGDGHFSVANHAEVAQLAYNAIKAGAGGAGGAGGASASAGAGGTTNGGASAAGAGGTSVGGAAAGGAAGAETGGTSAAGAAVGGSAGATVASAGSVATAGSAAIAGSAGALGVGGSGGSPSSEPASSSESSGCAIVAHSATRSPAGWLALLGGALLLGRRRRRSGPAA